VGAYHTGYGSYGSGGAAGNGGVAPGGSGWSNGHGAGAGGGGQGQIRKNVAGKTSGGQNQGKNNVTGNNFRGQSNTGKNFAGPKPHGPFPGATAGNVAASKLHGGPSKYKPGLNGKWDPKDWTLAWNRHWYFHHPQWLNGQWCWWDPDASGYVACVPGDSCPEDAYVEQAYPAPAAAIRIVNPDETETTMSYALNDYPYEIKPGEAQGLNADQTWVIAFDRSGNFGQAQYTLEPGKYTFAMTDDHGWELYHEPL
jgi:hypothetical protein